MLTQFVVILSTIRAREWVEDEWVDRLAPFHGSLGKLAPAKPHRLARRLPAVTRTKRARSHSTHEVRATTSKVSACTS
ncbi:MAG: hypothetical protein ACRD82_06400, partial [Blastocatellia bacterium]